jgi:hypothetical protein
MMPTFLNIVTAKSSVFWDITPCSAARVNLYFSGIYHFHLQAILGSCLAYSSALKIEMILSYEMSVDFIRITRCYVPEDRTLHSHRRDNLKSNIITILLITNRMETNPS